ncbi:hypothetical protein LSTR_LSTR007939 [Laodelphax striatellus]|uniref:Uncharacterized protein n=1 Tax=Laodelphax striatellus TaxID=195883 RepID=A0A482XRZ1_LAOST|nr:hypothetical protein LSTR_LSTR007939 [Laodelphax striatellus]
MLTNEAEEGRDEVEQEKEEKKRRRRKKEEEEEVEEEEEEDERPVLATEQATCWGPKSPINYTLTLDDKEGRRWNERLHKEVEDAELVWNGRNTSSEMVAVVS